MRRLKHATVAFLLASLPELHAAAADYHVKTDGSDDADGSTAGPWKTIQKAASTMVAGDSVTVHGGTYREWINPSQGGNSKDEPIVYRAAEGEDVYIKGSEEIDGWEQDGSVWRAVIPNDLFGDFNPYTAMFTGEYLTSGATSHLGEVYLNGAAYSEVFSAGEVEAAEGTWFVQGVDGSNTTLIANFGSADPNAALAEINVRKFAIFPTKYGLKHITIQGFHVLQGATNWAPPTAEPQEGLIATNFGFAWTIENNHIRDGKTVCVSGGLGTGDNGWQIDRSGNHVIRHNTIERCGEAAIAGSHGMVASIIEGNLIQDIHTPNYKFGGWECAGIKIHTAVDVLIKDNVIRRIGAGAVGIWIDWQAQGSRLTGNVIYDTVGDVMTLEVNHGPTLIDNNVFIGPAMGDSSEATYFVHNLMDVQFAFGLTDARTPYYFDPHTTNNAGQAAHASADNKYYNNILVSRGTSYVPEATGFASDYNVLYGGAAMSTWADANSIVDTFDADFAVSSLDNGVEVSFKANDAPRDVQCPLITREFIGLATLTQQGIENHDGTPITIDHDLVGDERDPSHPTAGPLENVEAENTIRIIAGTDLKGTTGGSGGSGAGSGGVGGGGGSNGGTTGGNQSGGGDAGAPEGGAPSSGGTGGTSDGTGGSGDGTGGGSGGDGGGAGRGTGAGGGNTGGRAATNGGTGATSAAGKTGIVPPEEDGGCGCAVPRATKSPWSAVLIALALAVAVRRRQGRGAS